MLLSEAKHILKKNGYKIENLPGQEYIEAIKKIFPDADIKVDTMTRNEKTRIAWNCSPEEPDPEIEWEESTIGFRYVDDEFYVWIPDWEHLVDDDYYGGEWMALYNPKGIKDYVDAVHKEAEQYKAEIGTEEN